MILAIFAIAAVTNTLANPISGDLLRRWGFGADQLRGDHPYRLFLAAFEIYRPHMAIGITAMILVFVGACEYRLGTLRAIGAFFAGHVVGYVGGNAVILLLGSAGSRWATGPWTTPDVGASNGAFGAAGAALLFLGVKARRAAFAFISIFLIVTLFVERSNWNIEHMLAFATGLAVGWVYLRSAGERWPGVLPQWRIENRQRPGLIAWCLRVTGVVNILSAFLLPHHERFADLEAWLPAGGPNWPRHLLFVMGLLLLTLAPGLARRQRASWWGAFSVLMLSLIVQFQLGVGWFEAVIAGTLILILLGWRRDFRAPAHPPSLRTGVRLLGSLVVAVPLYGLIGFFVMRSRFDPPVTIAGAIVETFARVFFSPAQFVADGRAADWFVDSIPLVAWLGVVFSVALIARSRLGPQASGDDLAEARDLLTQHGESGSSYMTLWPGNSLFFGPARDCYVAFRVNGGVAVALGDPIGEPASRGDTIRAFTEHVDHQGWVPVFYGVTPALLSDYRSAGYELLQIGEEAVISLPQLNFQGKQWQDVRSAINRAGRTGLSFRMFEGGSIPPEIREQLVEISDAWSAERELPSMGFTLGKTEDVDDPNVNVAVAFDETGRVHAFVDWLPVYARRGWVLDLMRRRDDAMQGVMDFLIANSLMVFKQRSYETASLATAPLADVDGGDTNTLLDWILRRVFEKSTAYYGFRSLFQYKAKFNPGWESIYLAHRGPTTLPAVGASLLRAYLPDLGFAEGAKLLGESAARLLFPERKSEQ